MVYRGISGMVYDIEEKKFRGGSGGSIHLIHGNDKQVAKIFKTEKRDVQREQKLKLMVQMNKFTEVQLKHIAWPQDVIYDQKGFAGYIMPKAMSISSLTQLYSDDEYHLRYRLLSAINLCAAIDDVHAAGQVCGDLNPQKICINLDQNGGDDKFQIILVDVDSYHFTVGDTIYRCEVGLPDYLAPEIQKKVSAGLTLRNAALPTYTRETDLFVLAVHIFALLMNGCHPFACAKDTNRQEGDIARMSVTNNRNSVVAPQPIENIRDGFFPFYQRKDGISTPIYAPDFNMLPKEIQDMFIRAFVKGYDNPSCRPSALEWQTVLLPFLVKMARCDKNHYYFNHLNTCPFCKVNDDIVNLSEKLNQQPASSGFLGDQQEIPIPTPPSSALSHVPQKRHVGGGVFAAAMSTDTLTGTPDIDNYVLKPDTILENRYRIERVIGEGGFGITYEAVNEKIDMTVAIKELYCREYIKRNVSESDDIQITYAATAEIFAQAKKRFLQEAKILSGFSSENAIVKILDYFEANGTAYIVMNYLQGISLDKYLKQNGPMNWETVLDKFKPLISTLERVHNRGVIHRDISTNNIMILEDGSLCLLDFGSAKDSLKNGTKTASIVFTKQGYTPIEQYAKAENIGSWSDVYALSAVCYECLTGECPPDSLQRALFDEYKTLREQGKNVPDGLENLLKKGLAVQVEDRYANMKELLDAVNQVLLKKVHKKPKKRILTILLIAVLFGIGGVCFYQNYREEILFRFEDTETFCLVTDEEISIDKFNKSMKKIEERIQVFVGDEPYILEEQNGTIRGVLPLKCFGKEDPVDIVRNLISYPNKWTIMGCEIERKYIANISYEDDKKENLVINLTKETPKDLQDTLLSLCKNGDADLAVDSEYKNCLLFEGKMESTLAFTWNVQSQWDDENIKDLFLHNLSHEELDVRFNTYPQIQSIWEERGSSTTFGKKQCNIGELSENRITLELVTSLSSDLTDGEVIDFISTLKEDLDILDIPYAIGRERNFKQRIILCVNQKDYSKDMFSLMLQSYGDLEIQDAWGRTIISGLSLENLTIEKDTSEKYRISSHVDDDSTKEVEKNTKKMINRNITEYYLTANNIRLLKGELMQKSGKLIPIKDGVFHLHPINTDVKEMGDEYVQMINLCNQILSKKQINNGYQIVISHYSNGKESVSAKPEIGEKGFRFDTSKEDDIIEALTELSDEYEIKSYYNDYGGKHLTIILPSDIYIEYFINSNIILDQICGIMDTCGIQNGTPWNTITIGVLSREKEKSYAGKIFFDHSNDTGNAKYPYSICVIGFDESETKWLKEIYNEMKSDNRFKDYQIEFEDYSNYYVY